MINSASKKTQKPALDGELAIYHYALAVGTFTADTKIVRRFARQVYKLIHDGGEPETIDGVCFDLRYPRLSPRDWGLSVFMAMIMEVPAFSTGLKTMERPSLWFPWFIDIESKEEVLEEAVYYNTMQETRELRRKNNIKAAEYSESQIMEIIQSHIPECFVKAGDTVRISDVADKMIGDKFDNQTDSTLKHVYIEVVRSDGEICRINTPIFIEGNNAIILDYYESGSHFLNVAWRMTKTLGYASLDKLRGLEFKDRKKTIGASLVTDLLDVLSHSKEGKRADALYSAVNKAVLLGFLWGKIEADTTMRPLAETALQRKVFNREGGKRSGDARRKIAKDGWMKIAKRLAFEIRAKQPDLSQDRLVRAIEDAWGENRPVAPLGPTLKKYISYLEKKRAYPQSPERHREHQHLSARNS